MQANRQVWDNADDVEKRLGALGLNSETLVEAARRGLSAFAACTPHHPRNFPALASWAESMRGLRDLLVVSPFRWSSMEENGQPQIHDPSGTIVLTVAGGDKNTGRLGEAEPRTSSSKGHTTSRATVYNAYLFPQMEKEARERIEREIRRQTWFLLIHRDVSIGELRCELSMPISMAEDRHIDGWRANYSSIDQL